MKNEIISVVVPIYNASKFLNKCLKSILDQTYEELEIILVNDGSTDNSLEICNSYAKTDKRIKVIDKENGGVSSARNRGIEEATGKYIVFIDADDYIEKTMFEVLSDDLFKYDVDMTMCVYKKVDINGNILFASKELKEKYFDDKTFKHYLFMPDYYREILCNKLFKLDIIKNNNIRFREDIHLNENIVFILDFAYFARKYVFDNQILYNFVQHKESATNEKFSLKKVSVLSSYIRLLEYNLEKEILNRIKYKYLFEGYAFTYRLKKLGIDNKELKENLKQFKNKYYEDIKNEPSISANKKRQLWLMINFNWLYCQLRKDI